MSDRPPTEPSTSEHDLLETLVDESRRREGRLADGAKRASEDGPRARDMLEELRTEAHALKGAAAVLGQTRLFELGRALEDELATAAEDGKLGPRKADAIGRGARAYVEGAEAAAKGGTVPPSVMASIEDLAAARR
jgi:HPt (histidine-containing phosphotransfer) domain-containing protein